MRPCWSAKAELSAERRKAVNPLLDMTAVSTVSGAKVSTVLAVGGGDTGSDEDVESDGAASAGGNGDSEIETECMARSREV